MMFRGRPEVQGLGFGWKVWVHDLPEAGLAARVLFRLELLWEGETEGDWMWLAPHQPSKAQTGLVCSFLRFVAAGGVARVEVLSTFVQENGYGEAGLGSQPGHLTRSLSFSTPRELPWTVGWSSQDAFRKAV